MTLTLRYLLIHGSVSPFELLHLLKLLLSYLAIWSDCKTWNSKLDVTGLWPSNDTDWHPNQHSPSVTHQLSLPQIPRLSCPLCLRKMIDQVDLQLFLLVFPPPLHQSAQTTCTRSNFQICHQLLATTLPFKMLSSKPIWHSLLLGHSPLKSIVKNAYSAHTTDIDRQFSIGLCNYGLHQKHVHLTWTESRPPLPCFSTSCIKCLHKRAQII